MQWKLLQLMSLQIKDTGGSESNFVAFMCNRVSGKGGVLKVKVDCLSPSSLPWLRTYPTWNHSNNHGTEYIVHTRVAVSNSFKKGNIKGDLIWGGVLQLHSRVHFSAWCQREWSAVHCTWHLTDQDTSLIRTPHWSGHLTDQDTSLIRTPH